MSFVKAVALDFDGVVVESVEIKNRAFGEIFRDRFPDKVDEIVAFQAANVGMSRFEKFPLIYEHVLGLPFPDGEMERLDHALSAVVFEGVATCAFVPGAKELIERRSATYPFYVASATPEHEARRLVKRRGLAQRFRAVYGSPTGKPDILRGILADEGLEPQELLFVGDAEGDLAAAQTVGTRFVGRVPEGAASPFRDVPVVVDLAELDERWDSVVGR